MLRFLVACFLVTACAAHEPAEPRVNAIWTGVIDGRVIGPDAARR